MNKFEKKVARKLEHWLDNTDVINGNVVCRHCGKEPTKNKKCKHLNENTTT